MDAPAEPNEDDLIARLIQGIDPGSFVTKHIVVAEIIGADGEKFVWVTGSQETTRWDMYGLLTEALMIEKIQQLKGELEP